MEVEKRDIDPFENYALSILYEEGPVLAVNKPAGILTQAPVGIDSLESRVKDYLRAEREKKERLAGEDSGSGPDGDSRENASLSGNPAPDSPLPDDSAQPRKIYLGVPHRLDRPASGVIVFAKHVRAANRLSEQFQSRTVVKKYWALVTGEVPDEKGTWTDYMRKIPGRAEAELIPPIHPDAREAILHYRVLGRLKADGVPISWLEIELETGRTHQIRLQTSSRGYPILGDALYGGTIPFGDQFVDERFNAIALHSRQMTFRHPMTKEEVTLVAPLSPPWKALIPDPVD